MMTKPSNVEHRPAPSVPDGGASLSYEALRRFRLIFSAVQQHSQSLEATLGVSSAQLWALWEMEKNPGLKVTDLARAMSLHQSTASNLLLKLEKKGLIRRERSKADQRVVHLNLTEAGAELVADAPGPKRGLLQQALFELPDSVLLSLTECLDALVAEMKIVDDDAAMRPILSDSTTKRMS